MKKDHWMFKTTVKMDFPKQEGLSKRYTQSLWADAINRVISRYSGEVIEYMNDTVSDLSDMERKFIAKEREAENERNAKLKAERKKLKAEKAA